jgi:Kinesin motor domain
MHQLLHTSFHFPFLIFTCRISLSVTFCSLFESLEEISSEGLESVTYSHMEIYNENVRDLLAPNSVNRGTNEYLRVREHPTRGIFVSNLTTIRVSGFEDLMSLIAIGDKNRTVGATNANAHSSRSHAVVTLTVVQRSRAAVKNGLPTSALQQKVGRVHLVDLAGSERVALSGAQGTRLREANNINRSLSVLGDVIKCLGDSKSKKNGSRKGHVPYRNSTLTMVLKVRKCI